MERWGGPRRSTTGWTPFPRRTSTGFAYTAKDMSWLAKRLKVRVPTYEPWEPWCALQQSHPTPDGYRCYPGRQFRVYRHLADDARPGCRRKLPDRYGSDDDDGPAGADRLHAVRDVRHRQGLQLPEPAELQLRRQRRVRVRCDRLSRRKHMDVGLDRFLVRSLPFMGTTPTAAWPSASAERIGTTSG